MKPPQSPEEGGWDDDEGNGEMGSTWVSVPSNLIYSHPNGWCTSFRWFGLSSPV